MPENKPITYHEYIEIADRELPSLNIKKNQTLSVMAALEAVAVELFLRGINSGELASRTRGHLSSLYEKGYHGFARGEK